MMNLSENGKMIPMPRSFQFPQMTVEPLDLNQTLHRRRVAVAIVETQCDQLLYWLSWLELALTEDMK
jgi:hypothetical protein